MPILHSSTLYCSLNLPSTIHQRPSHGGTGPRRAMRSLSPTSTKARCPAQRERCFTQIYVSSTTMSSTPTPYRPTLVSPSGPPNGRTVRSPSRPHSKSRLTPSAIAERDIEPCLPVCVPTALATRSTYTTSDSAMSPNGSSRARPASSAGTHTSLSSRLSHTDPSTWGRLGRERSPCACTPQSSRLPFLLHRASGLRRPTKCSVTSWDLGWSFGAGRRDGLALAAFGLAPTFLTSWILDWAERQRRALEHIVGRGGREEGGSEGWQGGGSGLCCEMRLGFWAGSGVRVTAAFFVPI
ncbi:hypothetical protein DFP72DRAFT_854625 [Ephemerocybe angulata]|uniref:Uncharacterized protein n=1 Tax=Ephemerocybe angulata TaxID=980116 RepID=A0A8H6M0J4_9AGAR|nr:hypothetical protein DFP72DRAFT_854625 [Tulosesus angulatus]